MNIHFYIIIGIVLPSEKIEIYFYNLIAKFEEL